MSMPWCSVAFCFGEAVQASLYTHVFKPLPPNYLEEIMGTRSLFSEGKNGKQSSPTGEGPNPRWEVYIAALRGNRTSIAPDLHKIKADNARQRAEERFFRSRHKSRHLLRKKY